MRILQVVHGFPPKEWTGTELVTLQLSQTLRGRGHEVTVVARTYDATVPEGTVQDELFEQLPVFRVVNNDTQSGAFRLLYDNPWLNRPFLQLLERIRPEIVHFQHTQHLSVSLLRLTPALGYPTVLSLHDFFFACHRVHLLDAQQRLCPGPERGERCVACLQELASTEEARQRFTDMERVLRAPDVLVTPSAFLADKMRGYFPFLTDRLRAVPLGVKAIPGVTPDRAPRPPGAPLRILYVGVLAPHKGAHVLIEALKGLPDKAVEVSLYGLEWSQWATYIAQLHETAKELPVKFCGTYTHDQLGDIFMQHDVLVMPMIWEETFSILTREALLAGMPVIAARRGALIEAVQEGVNGLLFEPENAADLQCCLARCITEPGLLERLRSAVPSVKTIEQYASDLEGIYGEVMTQRKGQPYFPPLEKKGKVQDEEILLSQQASLKEEGEQGAGSSPAASVQFVQGPRSLAELAMEVGRDWRGDSRIAAKYYESAEQWIEQAWVQTIWPFIQICDFSCVVDLAAGHGRNTKKLLEVVKKLYVVDINADNIRFCQQRFAEEKNVTYIQNDGFTLNGVPSGEVSLVYCFDAMGHFDSDVIRSYLHDFHRVLKPGGYGFCHYSNYDKNPAGNIHDNPGWRNFMSQNLFHHYCAKEGLAVVKSQIIDWDTPNQDCVTLFRKPFGVEEKTE